MTALQAPSVSRQRLGVALRRLRDNSGLSAEQVARRLSWSASKVSRIETARIGVSVHDVRRLLKIYGADDQVAGDLLTLAAEAGQSRHGWWDAYPEVDLTEISVFVALEDEAASALYFQADVIPALLQTEEYARHVLEEWSQIVPAAPTAISRRLEVRMLRQRLLQQPRRLPVSVVLDEAVLLRRFGQPGTMVRQLQRLVEVAALPNVSLRVLPLGVDHGPGLGSFTLLEFPSVYDISLPPVVHVESVTATHLQDENVTHMYTLCHRWLVKRSIDTEGSIRMISSIARAHWGNI